MVKSIWKQKTFWAGLTGIVTALGGYAMGELVVADALQVIVTALIGMFIRQGMSKPN